MSAWHHNSRRMTKQRRARLLEEHGRRCYKCTRELRAGDDWDIEHIHALELGGTDDDANLAPCCDWCHTDKTADDHAEAGHMRRAAAKHLVPTRFQKGRGWR